MIGSMELLRRVRSGLDRLSPADALAEQQQGAVLIDVRTEAQRADAVGVPGALVIDLTVLLWRLDPGCRHRVPEATDWDTRYDH